MSLSEAHCWANRAVLLVYTLMNVYMRETWAMEKDHQCLHFRASWPAVAVLTLLIQISGLIVPGCE